jgi:Uma2 family endonuclease
VAASTECRTRSPRLCCKAVTPPNRLSSVEILSPGDRLRATLAKCKEYHASGVPFCWVIDPEKQTAWQYHSGAEPEHVERGGALTAGELSVPLEELFSELPR